MANITFLRDSVGITITQVNRPVYTNTNTAATIEIVGGTDIWVTMTADRAQFIFNLTDTITINGVVYSGTLAALQIKLRDEVLYTYSQNPDVAYYEALGSSFYGENHPIALANAGNSIASGTAKFDLMRISKTGNMTGILVFIATSGVYTPNNFNGIGLFTVNAATGAYTRVAISADTPALWSGAAGYYFVPFTAPYAVKVGEIYAVCSLYNTSAQTTAPQVRGVNLGSAAASSYPFANSIKISGALSSQTAIPASTTGAALSAASTSIRVQGY